MKEVQRITMSNALYTKAKQGLLDGSLDLDTDTIKSVFVDGADYTPNMATHQYLSDIPSAARVATSGALQNKTVTDGVFDADDITLTAVTGDQFEYIVLYKDTGVEGTSRLILLIDTATGLPCTPNGSDITIQWSSGADKIFRLS
jgi:hypothetical protein